MRGLDILLIIVAPIAGLFILAYVLDKRRLKREKSNNPPTSPIVIIFMLVATAIILLLIGYIIITRQARGSQNSNDFIMLGTLLLLGAYLLIRVITHLIQRKRV
jgi:uncharacterized membrane protein